MSAFLGHPDMYIPSKKKKKDRKTKEENTKKGTAYMPSKASQTQI
jgi:hypothetical protein